MLAHQLQQSGTIQDQEPCGDIQQGETDDGQTHDGTAAECHLQTFVKALTGTIGGTRGSIGGGLHAQEAGQTGEETAGQEGEPHHTVLQVEYGHD